MLGFASSGVSLRLRSAFAPHVAATPAPRRAARARVAPRACVSSQEEWDTAFDSGAELRDSLERVSAERREQSERTTKRLNDMSSQLSAIMAEIREQAGMPPVAAAPPPSVASRAQAGAADAVADARKEAAGPGGSSESIGDDPYSDPMNLGYDSAAGWQVLASENQLPTIDGGSVKFRVECDQDGCSIIELQGANAPPGPGVRSQFMQSGLGYRVGYDPQGSSSFCGAVGSEAWLLALSRDEIRHFKRLTLALQKKMDRIARGLDEAPEQKAALRRSGDGMFNERITKAGADCSVELESKLLWVQALGSPELGSYCIRAIFMEGRQSEAYWAPKYISDLLTAVGKLAID